MAQVDTLNYWPLLCWFLVSFILFYILVFLYLIPFIYKYLKIQRLFLDDQIWYSICYKFLLLFLQINLNFDKNYLLNNLINKIVKLTFINFLLKKREYFII